ncbi:MAG: extracellular solute-binding protein [Cephaloticoccus sp.]|nr:extracellular solute-binding protein [Cephaloticoccus sp.]MCF7760961.1 extracellular solute-binding protein [Cephaloticoccus sp.]
MNLRVLRKRVGLILFVTGYVVAVAWVFTRSQPMEAEDVTTIRIAHWQIELGPPDGIAAVIARYEELNPKVRVKQVMVPGPVYRQWMRANFAGDNAPDIVEYGAWLDGLADLPVRYFQPLTEELLEPNPYNAGTALAGMPWQETFFDELQEQRLNSPEPGQYYAVTMTRGSLRLFCNEELLEKITGSRVPPADWTAMRTLFKQTAAYAKKEGRIITPFAGSKDNAMWMMAFYMGGVMNDLGRRLDAEGMLGLYPRQTQWQYLRGDWHYRDPEVKAALSLLLEINDQMRPGYMSVLRDEASRQFLRSEALFIFTGTWDATSLRRLAEFEVGVLRCPQPTKTDPLVGKYMLGHFSDGNSMTGFGFYLNKRSPHREIAVDFMRFLTSYEGNKLFTDKSGWLPSIKTVPVAPEIASYISPDDGYAYGGPNVTLGGGSRATFESNLHHMVGPQGSVEKLAQALDAAMPEVTREALQVEQRAARWAMLPQDTRIVALDNLVALQADHAAEILRRERLESAQNLSEGRALLLGRQLELTAP